MRNLIFKIHKIWDQFGPAPIHYAIMKNKDNLWYVALLRKQFKHRIGPYFSNKVDVFKFYDSITTTGEAKYEWRIYRRRSIYWPGCK